MSISMIMKLILNLFFYGIMILTPMSKTISNGVAAASRSTTENMQQQQKQKHLRRVLLKQNNDTDSQIKQFEQHHELEENLNTKSSITLTTTKTKTTLNNKNTTSMNTTNDNEIDKKNARTKRRQITGKFTIVKAMQPSDTKLNDIILGEFNNGDIINIYGKTKKKYSMYIDHSGPMDHMYFQYYDTNNKLIKKNSTTFDPFALTYHKKHQFDPLDILSTPGNHKIDITAYIFGLRIANIILSFTIINDPSKPESFQTMTSRISKRKKPKFVLNNNNK